MISEVNEAFQECFTTLWYGGLNETLFEMEPGHRESERRESERARERESERARVRE